MRERLFDASEWGPSELKAELGDRLLVQPKAAVRIAYLDTFDWRIHRRRASLTVESTASRTTLYWREESKPDYSMPIDAPPRFIDDLPQGFLRDRLGRIVDPRALLEIGSSRNERLPMQVVDDGGNLCASLVLEDLVALDHRGRRTDSARRILTLRPSPDAKDAVGQVLSLLGEQGLEEAPDFVGLALAAAVHGRSPGDYSSKPKVKLRAKERADRSLRTILLQLLSTLEANVDGVIADTDIEFLHDLRVATRRTRSALSQVKGVLPKDRAREFAAEFKWLGEVTGPLRDLDVFLYEMPGFHAELGGEDGSLGPLQRLLRRNRRNELRRVRRALRSKRFHALVSHWQAFLDDKPKKKHEGKQARRPIRDVADARIFKAYNRMIDRGAHLGDAPPAAELHRLRIDAKKLRYLLEFFFSLYPEKTISRLVKELKQLQDILGGFNDMDVQQRWLHDFADTLIEEQSARSETVFDMSRLAQAMAARQERYRLRFAKKFAVFANDESREIYLQTFGGES
jgi:CHAD domain-containing protein